MEVGKHLDDLDDHKPLGATLHRFTGVDSRFDGDMTYHNSPDVIKDGRVWDALGVLGVRCWAYPTR